MVLASDSRHLLQVQLELLRSALCSTEGQLEEELVDSVHQPRGLERVEGENTPQLLVVVDS